MFTDSRCVHPKCGELANSNSFGFVLTSEWSCSMGHSVRVRGTAKRENLTIEEKRRLNLSWKRRNIIRKLNAGPMTIRIKQTRK